MNARRWALGAALALAVVAWGCDDADLRAVNRSVTVEGRYCTNDSTTFSVPIRVLLIVDTSQSMEINDPTGFRGKAAEKLVVQLQDKGADASFAFIHFNTAAVELTQGFSKDRPLLLSAISGLNRIEGFTNYLAALGMARTVIAADIAKTAEELKALEKEGKDTRYRRPWYFVVFLSDGIPRMPGGVLQPTEAILAEEELLLDVPSTATGITLHTAFLGAKDDLLRPQAESLLSKMAAEGHGSYFSFTRGDEIDFSVFDFQIKRLFDIKQLLVYNRSSALPGEAEAHQPDSDQDGLADEEELALGTDPLGADTDGDGLGDGFEARLALSPVRAQSSVCTDNAQVDSDNDGLNDCEEDFLSLKKDRFDTDGDLYPDRFEVLSGANAGDRSDTLTDLDFDGVPTGLELRQRTKVTTSDAALHEHYGQRFQLVRHFDRDKGSYCFDYEVSNVAVVRTKALGDRPAGLNELVIEFVESPEDRPEELFTLNRLVVPVDYSEYQRSRVVVGEAKFLPIANQELPVR